MTIGRISRKVAGLPSATSLNLQIATSPLIAGYPKLRTDNSVIFFGRDAHDMGARSDERNLIFQLPHGLH
jgi:hypothetical protein